MATTSSLVNTLKSKSSYTYNAKGKKVTSPPKYITNTANELRKGKRMNPKNKEAVGITSKIDKGMKFNLNMNRGSGSRTYNMTHYFDRLYSIYPEEEIETFCPYVFIVRPDLNILDTHGNKLVSITNTQRETGYYPNTSPSKDPFFIYMRKDHPNMLRSISGDEMSGHDFISYLVGRTESLQIPDYQVKDYNINQPYTNFNLPYASHAIASTTGGQVEVTFRDDKDLRIHKMIQAWLYYIDGVTRNVFGPRLKYIQNNKFDYMCSIYYMLCGPDATTLKYWHKFTGAFPILAPNSGLSFNLRGKIESQMSVTFAYFYQEPMNLASLYDFNKNAHVIESGTPYIPLYNTRTIKSTGMTAYSSTAVTTNGQKIGSLAKKFDKKTGHNRDVNIPSVLGVGNGMAGCPFIVREDSDYKLRWKKVPTSLGKF